ncbi:hypothetical protein M1403_00420 [Patescibacteria group bacterium]|nr:hypothetical protein [Patescibacteria group bacterium]
MKTNNSLDLKKIRPYFFFIFLFVVFAAELGVLVIFAPSLYSTILSARASLAAQTAEVNTLSDLVTALNQTDPANLAALQKKVTAALPDEKKTAGVVTGLTRLASSSGVVVNSLEFSPGLISTGSATAVVTNTSGEIVLGGGVKAIPAQLTVTADVPAVSRFLADLAKSSQMIGVTSVEYTHSGPKTSTALGLLLYFQPPKEGAVTPKQVQPLTSQEVGLAQSLPQEDIFTVAPE